MRPPSREQLRSDAVQVANAVLERTARTSQGTDEARRELAWWLAARVAAVQAKSPRMLRGSGLGSSRRGYVELVPIEVPAAGPGQVTVRSEVSSINVGTERAQYLNLPNAARIEGSQPSGSLAGTVLRVGRGVSDLEVGQRVAVLRAPHSSVVTARAQWVLPVPQDVSDVGASLILHGIIAGHGVELGELGAGTPFGMVGVGIIGSLALRMAVAAGAPARAVVATSRAKEPLALAGGAERFLVSGEDDEAIAALGLPVVFEVTGDPQALRTAVAMAATGGRIVLLGSSRGTTDAVPIAEIRRKGLTLIGAHIDTLKPEAAKRRGLQEDGDAERRAASSYLELLESGRLRVDDLITRTVDPREAAVLYREMIGDRTIVGAAIDWSRLPRDARAGGSHLLRPPPLTGRGVAFDEPRPRRARASRDADQLVLPDPFAGATGELRIGMLGCGDIATHNAGAIASAPNARLVACYDPSIELAQDIADAHGAERVLSAEALVEHPSVDAVFISVPHHLHEPLALLAIAAGRHVIVEKPLAVDVRSAETIVAAAASAGVVLSTCFAQRYEPSVLMARALIERGALGEIGGSSVRVLMDKSPAYWQGGYSGRAHSTWRASQRQAGGGVLIMNVCHYVDIVRHLAGVEVDSVSAISSVPPGQEVEDAITVSMRYANGAVGSIVANSTVRGTTYNEMQLWGRDGHLVVEPNGRFFSLRHVNGAPTARWQHFGALPSLNSRSAFVSRLATAIDQGLEPDVTPFDGLAVQALIEAAYRSAGDGVSVDPAALMGGADA